MKTFGMLPQSHIMAVFDKVLSSESFADVTLGRFQLTGLLFQVTKGGQEGMSLYSLGDYG
jgi:hypothetical protein